MVYSLNPCFLPIKVWCGGVGLTEPECLYQLHGILKRKVLCILLCKDGLHKLGTYEDIGKGFYR